MIIDADLTHCDVRVPPRVPVDATALSDLSRRGSSAVGDAMGRQGVMDAAMRRIAGTGTTVGPALTVWTREGDNLAVHAALDLCAPGDILVIDGRGFADRALFGEILAELCISRKVRGVVVNGAVRDVDSLVQLGLPVWATAISPAGPFKSGPGAVGGTIACAGVPVSTDDIVVADADGVAVIPQQQCAIVRDRAAGITALEDDLRSRARGAEALGQA